MKQISLEQIEQVLQLVYNTDITAKNFDALKKFFRELPNIPEVKDKQ